MSQEVMMRAMLDVVKERFAAKNGRQTVTLPTSIEAVMPEVHVANDVDMTPVAHAIDRAFERQTQALERFNVQPPAPVFNVPEPVVRYEAAAPSIHVDGTQVIVDMTPVAEAIQKQTECFEKLIGKLLSCLDKGKEIEIIKDSNGRITGARRK